MSSADGKILLNNWPPQNGHVSLIAKDMGNRQVIHLINFANASTFDWRDTNGQPNGAKNLSKHFIHSQNGEIHYKIMDGLSGC